MRRGIEFLEFEPAVPLAHRLLVGSDIEADPGGNAQASPVPGCFRSAQASGQKRNELAVIRAVAERWCSHGACASFF